DSGVIVEIDTVIQLGKLLYPGSGAAPKGVVGSAESLPGSRRDGEIVLRCAGMTVDRGQPVIIERSLVVIEVTGIRRPAVKVAGKLQHVVSAAALRGRGAAPQFFSQMARLNLPAFAIAGSTGNIGARAGDFIPEEIRDVMKALVGA